VTLSFSIPCTTITHNTDSDFRVLSETYLTRSNFT
jgi:hypothetical protein